MKKLCVTAPGPHICEQIAYRHLFDLFSSQETRASSRRVLPDKTDFFLLFPSPQILILKTQKEIELC